MKKILVFTVLLAIITSISAQSHTFSANDLMGTWKYEKNDTLFKIRFSKVIPFPSRWIKDSKAIIGNYQLIVKGKVVQDFFSDDLPDIITSRKKEKNGNVTIIVYVPKETNPKAYAFIFYDMVKKHRNGEGIAGCKMRMLSPTQLKWDLNEFFEWSIEEHDVTEKFYFIGFSVPNNIILTKEQ